MKRTFSLLGATLAVLLAGASIGQGKMVSDLSLYFFIASETKFDGGHSFNAPELAFTGYVGSKPDLVVTELEYVRRGAPARSFMVDKDGKKTELPQRETIVIRFKPKDAAQFTALTERAIGKRLVMMLGNRPLMAPMVEHSIDSPSVEIALGTDEADGNRLLETLKHLTKSNDQASP
jgi:hypothetical protein